MLYQISKYFTFQGEKLTSMENLKCEMCAWMAQLVECPTLAQVMISWFVGSSPTSGSGLTAQSLEPVSESVSPSLFPSSAHTLSLSLSLSLSLKNK